MLSFTPYELGLGASTSGDNDSVRIRFAEDENIETPVWDIESRPNGRLVVYDHDNAADVAWFDTAQTLHVADLSIEGASSLDAGTLDGLDSAQFVRSDSNDIVNADLDVTGTLTQQNNVVLTEADEGTLDAGTLDGQDATDITPSVSDDGTEITAAVADLNLGQYLVVNDDGSGDVTIDSFGGNAVGTSQSASGDGSQTTFTVQHDLGNSPAAVDVTPLSADASADHYIENVTNTSCDITYTSAPPDASGNLEWYITAIGNDGSGKHAVQVDDDGTQITLASDLNFGSGLTVTDDGDNAVTIDAAVDTDMSVSHDGAQVLDTASDLNFADNLDVSDDGDETVTIDAVNTYPSVSSDGSVAVAAPEDINFADNLSVIDDGDDTITVHASGDAATLSGVDASQFLRSDTNDTHTTTLTLNTLDGGDNGRVSAVADLAFDEGIGLYSELGSSVHALRPARDNLQNLAQGSDLPTDFGMTLEADATIAFIETDNDRVAGWVDTNDESLTIAGGVRAGDANGAPTAALDVRGTADFNDNTIANATAENFAIESRTTDPSNPAEGQIWIREDLV